MREIDRGMSGPDVARWERFLVNKGHLARPGSGVFDEGSEAGTRAFQAASGMESSGRVDAVTLARGLADGLLDKNLSEEVRELVASSKRLDWAVFVPLMVAVIGGLSTAAISILNAQTASENALAAEREKLRSSIILQAIRTDDPEQALANLKFFAELGFIELTPAQVQRLERQPGSVPLLPSDGPRRLSMADLGEDWARQNIITVEIAQLRRVPTTSGVPFSGTVRFHRVAAPALQAAFAEIERLGLLGDIESFDGAYVPRAVRGGTTPSVHALGIAIDINVRANPFGRAPAPEGAPGSVLRLVPVFERHGFRWGGRSPRPEANHFEFADRSRLNLPAE